MAKTLVTGGAGFIGSHIARALLQDGWQVRILDDFSSGKMENLEPIRPDVELLQADLRDAKAVRNAVKDVQVIFHQAAFVSNPKSLLEPAECYATNVSGTQNLLEAARQAGVERVVLASSSAVYGEPVRIPIAEDSALKPLSPYAASKAINETDAGMYTRSMGLGVAALRYFNVYGPNQSPDSDYAAVIPQFIQDLLTGKTLTIHGDGLQTRDLVFVEDVVQANLLAARTPGAAGKAFNICTGIETSVRALADRLIQFFPGCPAPVHATARAGDIVRSCGDPALAGQILGFEAKTSLAVGLEKTLDWMRR